MLLASCIGWLLIKLLMDFKILSKLFKFFQYFYNNDLEIKPKKIILIGDSAGGNFALSNSN